MQNLNTIYSTVNIRPKPQNNEESKDCLKCGNLVSKHYFSSVKLADGRIVYPRCPNCGFFEDPE